MHATTITIKKGASTKTVWAQYRESVMVTRASLQYPQSLSVFYSLAVGGRFFSVLTRLTNVFLIYVFTFFEQSSNVFVNRSRSLSLSRSLSNDIQFF